MAACKVKNRLKTGFGGALHDTPPHLFNHSLPAWAVWIFRFLLRKTPQGQNGAWRRFGPRKG
jgi:hypothetical protein